MSASELSYRYGRGIIARTIAANVSHKRSTIILDIGCGHGDDLMAIDDLMHGNCRIVGVDFNELNIQHCQERGITARMVDIEYEQLPLRHADAVILSQVLEHCKNVYWVLSEVSRVLKPGGVLVVGVPNLATWYNRLLLLAGQQPREIKVPGSHVRGFTRGALVRFVTDGAYFKHVRTHMVGCKPFPVWAQRMIALLLPGMAATIISVYRRTEKQGVAMDLWGKAAYETSYVGTRHLEVKK